MSALFLIEHQFDIGVSAFRIRLVQLSRTPDQAPSTRCLYFVHALLTCVAQHPAPAFGLPGMAGSSLMLTAMLGGVRDEMQREMVRSMMTVEVRLLQQLAV